MNIHMIYLAAGNSRRFGENKLLYPVCHRPMYQHGLGQLSELLRRHDDYTLDVVTQYEEIMECVKELSGSCPRVRPVMSESSRLGLSYSIRAGISSYEKERHDYFLFLVADQPYIRWTTIQGMIDEAQSRGALLAAPQYRRRSGSPVLFHSSFYGELMGLEGDEGGRKLLRKHRDLCFWFPVEDPRELMDYDSREDQISLDSLDPCGTIKNSVKTGGTDHEHTL